MRVLGDNLFAMDEAPARESEREDDEGGPSFGALNEALDEAAEALEGIRSHLKRGAADSEGAFSFDAVRRRVADARDALDALEEQLGAGGGKDEEPGESDRDAAYARASDAQRVDHRKDFKSGAADSAIALDRRRGVADPDLDGIFKPAQAQGEGEGADACDLREIFAPVGNSA
jgi:hypothetical protein